MQRLFGIPPKPFSELDKTGEELKLLGLLYGLFQKFIAFDRKFRDTLWEGAKLHDANAEVGRTFIVYADFYVCGELLVDENLIN